jgi:hypothetical protein
MPNCPLQLPAATISLSTDMVRLATMPGCSLLLGSRKRVGIAVGVWIATALC